MQNDIVDRLLNSLNILESAIEGARGALSKKTSISPDVMARIDSYSDILEKQRAIAHGLSASVEAADWATVAQQVHVINRLLDMIRQDASEVLAALQGAAEHEDAESDSEMIIC